MNTCVLALSFAYSLSAATFYVNKDSTADLEDGSAAFPYKGIQSAVNAATGNGDEIVISGDAYPVHYVLSAPVVNDSGFRVTIRGATGKARDVVVDGDGKSHCFDLSNATVLSGLTVTNGVASKTVNCNFAPKGDHLTGGGCWLTGGAIMTNCVVTGCKAVSGTNPVRGGGVYARGATIVDCLVENCSVEQTGSTVLSGGGVWLDAQGGTKAIGVYTTMAGSEVRNCKLVLSGDGLKTPFANGGGGVYMCAVNVRDYARVDKVRIEANDTTGVSATKSACGGGIMVYNGSSNPRTNSLVSCCQVVGNKGISLGAGIAVRNARIANTLVATNVIVNTAATKDTYDGAGVYAYEGSDIVGCRIERNVVPGCGGGVYMVASSVLANCLVEGNEAEFSGGGVILQGDSGVSNTVIRCNVANQNGGGILILNVTGGFVRQCSIEGNSAGTNGGGIGNVANGTYSTHGFELSDCIVRTNVASAAGGGLASFMKDAPEGDALTVRNCLFVGNRAANTVGTWSLNETGTALFESCTFVGNENTVEPVFGYYTNSKDYRVLDYLQRTFFRNCLFSDNVSATFPDSPDFRPDFSVAYPGNVTYTFTKNGVGLSSEAAYHNVTTASSPRFAAPSSGDYRLKASSPLVGKGLVALDWMAGATDMGACRFDELAVGYGVLLSKVGERSRLDASFVDIGCCQHLDATGLILLLR